MKNEKNLEKKESSHKDASFHEKPVSISADKHEKSKDTRVILKVSGQLGPMDVFLKWMDTKFPISTKGPVKPNDSQDGYHLFVTVFVGDIQ